MFKKAHNQSGWPNIVKNVRVSKFGIKAKQREIPLNNRGLSCSCFKTKSFNNKYVPKNPTNLLNKSTVMYAFSGVKKLKIATWKISSEWNTFLGTPFISSEISKFNGKNQPYCARILYQIK